MLWFVFSNFISAQFGGVTFVLKKQKKHQRRAVFPQILGLKVWLKSACCRGGVCCVDTEVKGPDGLQVPSALRGVYEGCGSSTGCTETRTGSPSGLLAGPYHLRVCVRVWRREGTREREGAHVHVYKGVRGRKGALWALKSRRPAAVRGSWRRAGARLV